MLALNAIWTKKTIGFGFIQKQKDLKPEGKSSKINAFAALRDKDIQALYEKDLLESSTAEALFNRRGSTTQSISGYEAARAQRNVLGRCKTSSNLLEFNERETKLVQETILGM